MIITLKISSANHNSLENFSKILVDKLHIIKNIKFSIISTAKKRITRNKFTVLKSPHVNKTAREQFEIINYTRTFNIYCYQNLLLLFVIKRIKRYLSSDVKLKVNLNYNSNHIHKNLKSNLNLNNNYLNKFDFNKPQYTANSFDEISHSTKNYLKCLDVFGETIFKH